MSLQVVSTVRRVNVQLFTKRRLSALFWLTRTSPGANFHIGVRVYMQLFTNKIMSEIIGLTHAKDCDVYSLWKNVPMRNFLTYMDVSTCKFSHERTCLYTTCPMNPMFGLDRHVFTQCVQSINQSKHISIAPDVTSESEAHNDGN